MSLIGGAWRFHGNSYSSIISSGLAVFKLYLELRGTAILTDDVTLHFMADTL